jgi:hypothetical protein
VWKSIAVRHRRERDERRPDGLGVLGERPERDRSREPGEGERKGDDGPEMPRHTTRIGRSEPAGIPHKGDRTAAPGLAN